MANVLFQKLSQILQKNYGPNSNVIPFGIGRVYSCAYRNWHHDPKPLLFIIGSDAFYTVGINIHYVGLYGSALINFINNSRKANVVFTSHTIYQVLKTQYPMIPKIAYRKYFTSMLRGVKVSEGLSQIQEPVNTVVALRENWVRQLNNVIRPKVFSYNKVQYNPLEAQKIASQTIQIQYRQDSQKPYQNQKGISVQYNPQENING